MDGWPGTVAQWRWSGLANRVDGVDALVGQELLHNGSGVDWRVAPATTNVAKAP